MLDLSPEALQSICGYTAENVLAKDIRRIF